MINQINEFNLLTLDKIINHIFNKKDQVKDLINELGFLTYENDIGTLRIYPTNKIFSEIILSVKNNSLKNISFHGILSLTFKDLINKYGKFKETYSAYDDIYFYIFTVRNGITVQYRSESKMDVDTIFNLNQIAIDLN